MKTLLSVVMSIMLVALVALMVVLYEKPTPQEVIETPTFSYSENINSVVIIASDYGHGTGFCIGYDDEGYALFMTARHVVPEKLMAPMRIVHNPKYYIVSHHNDKQYDVEVVFRSEVTDMALVRFKWRFQQSSLNFVPASMANSLAEVGEQVFTISNPGIFRFAFSQGYVMSEKSNYLERVREYFKKMYKGQGFVFSLSGSGGSSGSPIWAMRDGEAVVVGMYNAKFRDGDIGFGLNLDSLKLGILEWQNVR